MTLKKETSEGSFYVTLHELDLILMTPIQKINKNAYATFLSLEEEWHRALGHDATFTWSRVLTHPPRCNRMHHRKVRGLMAAIMDRMW